MSRCADFKCNAIKGEVRHTLEVFKRQFWANLPAEKREAADFGRPVFPLVSLLLTAERHKLLVKIPARCWQSQGAALHARLVRAREIGFTDLAARGRQSGPAKGGQ